MDFEIVQESPKKNRNKSKKTISFIKFGITFITSFMILFGMGIITKLLFLEKYYEGLTSQGIYEITTLSLLIYIGTLIILNLFIYELNDKLNNHPVIIGLTLATIISLPTLVNSIEFLIPFQISFGLIINNYLSIILASYVFFKMNE